MKPTRPDSLAMHVRAARRLVQPRLTSNPMMKKVCAASPNTRKVAR